MRYYVICKECSENHRTDTIELLNVEEDIEGRDVVFFVCPVTEIETKSLVYSH